jgi:myo-inositol 2-dehydrogenase/D-chiro-inositol 1-dehydrogenase
MRVAVIGAGSMGGMHAALLGAMDDVTELLVVDADSERAAAVAARTGGDAVPMERAMEADAVVVATPPELHAATVETAIEAGRSVLCEKPLTDALATTIELTRYALETDAHLEVGFHRRHEAGFAGVRRAVEDGSTGRIHLLSLVAHDPLVPPTPEIIGPAPEAAPAFRDSSIHDFDVVRWLTDQEVVEVTVQAGRRDGTRTDDPRGIERAVTTMRLSDGTLAVLTSSWLHPTGYDTRVEIVAEHAALSAGLSPRTPASHLDWPTGGAESVWRGYLERFEPAYRAELVAFLAAARGEREPATSARDGLEAMRIAVAATRAHVEHRRVLVDEIAGLEPLEVA